MQTKNIVIIFIVTWITLTILGVTWRVPFNWPDNVHVEYGFPLVWGTHTQSTIAGPVDIWKFDFSALIIDLLLWLGSMTIVTFMILYIPRRK